jgi:exodeoxyribonuclease VII small subunit
MSTDRTGAGSTASPSNDKATATSAAATSAGSAGAPVPEDIAGLPFDRALTELQSVVGRLESGGLALEESISLYERGVALHEQCARLLGQAELRVQRLVDGAGGPRALDLRPDDEE